jgi:hypothetical protein
MPNAVRRGRWVLPERANAQISMTSLTWPNLFKWPTEYIFDAEHLRNEAFLCDSKILVSSTQHK